MPKIIPIKDLKNTAEVSDLCHKTQEPIFITKNGYGDMVLMSMETYEKAIKMTEVYRQLEISEQQKADGNEVDAFQSLNRMRERYGL